MRVVKHIPRLKFRNKENNGKKKRTEKTIEFFTLKYESN